MQPTYRAILRAGVIDWVDGPPPDLPSSEVHVMVTSLARPAPAGGTPRSRPWQTWPRPAVHPASVTRFNGRRRPGPTGPSPAERGDA